MEIERKYLVLHLPGPLESYPCRILEQGYLNTSPVVRIRRDNDRYEHLQISRSHEPPGI